MRAKNTYASITVTLICRIQINALTPVNVLLTCAKVRETVPTKNKLRVYKFLSLKHSLGLLIIRNICAQSDFCSNKLRDRSPQANYTDRATAACRRS
jgi:hypothetical protein